jgi:hypothetical protein
MIVSEQTVLGSVGATLEDLRESVALVASGAVKTLVDSVIPLASFQVSSSSSSSSFITLDPRTRLASATEATPLTL